MNASAPDATFRYGQVCRVLGLPLPTLRNWFSRNEIDLFQAKPKGGWLEFGRNDVYVLALALELVRRGADVKPAVTAAREALSSLALDDLANLPHYLYAAPDRQEPAWVVHDDEAMLRAVTGKFSVVKISLLELLNEIRKRLALQQNRRGAQDGETVEERRARKLAGRSRG